MHDDRNPDIGHGLGRSLGEDCRLALEMLGEMALRALPGLPAAAFVIAAIFGLYSFAHAESTAVAVTAAPTTAATSSGRSGSKLTASAMLIVRVVIPASMQLALTGAAGASFSSNREAVIVVQRAGATDRDGPVGPAMTVQAPQRRGVVAQDLGYLANVVATTAALGAGPRLLTAATI